MMIKTGLVSISFRSHSVEEIIAATKEAGLTAIEWGSDLHAPPQNKTWLREIASLQSKAGLYCSSYGTYFRLGKDSPTDILPYISAAKILGTTILRVWCGEKNSEEYTPEERLYLFEQSKETAKIVQEQGCTLCLECHIDTYTNRPEAALQILNAVDSPAFKMYWQPNQYRTEEENRISARLLGPYTVNIHVFQWKGDQRYPLSDGISIWKEYLSAFDKTQHLLLEFMPDNQLQQLSVEAASLNAIIQGENR